MTSRLLFRLKRTWCCVVLLTKMFSVDVSTSMTYIPGTGPQSVFPAVKLRVCPGLCSVSGLETRLTLETQQGGERCERDTYSLDTQRKMCGASNQAVELLPEHSGRHLISGGVGLLDLRSVD